MVRILAEGICRLDQRKRMRRKRICKHCLKIYLMYFLIGFFFPPLLHGTAAPQEVGFTGQNGAERVLCVEDNEESLLWRLRMISAAEHEIILSTFDFRDDNSGRDMMAALWEAADRGVDIRILVDGANGQCFLRWNRQFHALVSMPNVKAKFYSPINLLQPWLLNYRLHDKYLIIDDTAYLLGGRNTYDLFLGSYVDTCNIDRDILVYEASGTENTSLAQLRSYFEQIWALSSNQEVKAVSLLAGSKAQTVLSSRSAALKSDYPDAYLPFDWWGETMEARGITLLSNGVEPRNKAPVLWAQLDALMQTGSQIHIQTPYIICNQWMYGTLNALCESGTSVQIMTNGVENGANPFGCSDYINQKAKILDTGVDIVEWMGGQSLHTKTILIDDAISVVGSFNLDMRSTYLDTELMLVIDCPELNRQIQSSFAQMTEQSVIAHPNGHAEFGINCRIPDMSLREKVFYLILRIVLYPVRYLL